MNAEYAEALLKKGKNGEYSVIRSFFLVLLTRKTICFFWSFAGDRSFRLVNAPVPSDLLIRIA